MSLADVIPEVPAVPLPDVLVPPAEFIPFSRYGVFVDFIDLTKPVCMSANSEMVKSKVTITCNGGNTAAVRTTTSTGITCVAGSSSDKVVCTGMFCCLFCFCFVAAVVGHKLIYD